MRQVLLFAVALSLLATPLLAKEGKVDAESVQVFETGISDKPFKVLGKVHTKSSNLKYLSDTLRRLAVKHGGDAVLLYKVDNTGKISWWSGGQMSYAEGVVVKYDPAGITEIAANTPIPVLE